MKLLDILTAPWAIQPEKLLEIQAIYVAHARGERADIASVEAKLGRPLNNEAKTYEVIDGVAVLPVVGVSAKRANLFTQVSGGVSTELMARDLRTAEADPTVHSIVMHIDSPGGTVDGTQSLAQLVRDVGQVKPVVTLGGGIMASAAYWYGSAGSAIYVEDGTTLVGSIGVVQRHVDISAAEAQQGQRTTEITAGRYKRIASNYGPLTEEGRATIQAQVDYVYSLFVNAVAQHRGVSADKVLQDMADGRIFVGEQAIAAGLVDGVASLGQLVEQLNRNRSSSAARAALAAPQPHQGASMPLTREQLGADAPDLLKTLLAEGHEAGATAERDRIKAVQAQSMVGHEKLIADLMFDGKTSGPEAAVAVLKAEKALRGNAAANLAADAPKPVAAATTPAVEAPAADAADDKTLPLEERCKAKWDRSSDLRAEFASLAAFTAFSKAAERGAARIFSRKEA